MKDKICLITGANSGIGFAAAEEIARRGATVVLVCRNLEKANAAAEEMRKRTGSASVEAMAADVSSQSEIRRLAAEFQKKHTTLHMLINNAGIHSRKRVLSVDGIEMTFAVNHLAYFLLTNLLLGTIEASAPARIINVSSEAHRRGKLDFDDLQGEKRYSGFPAYCLSKLCNVLFTKELARRLQGKNVTVNALHPGVVATGIFRDTNPVVKGLMKILGLTPERGARTTVYLAASPEVEGVTGKYFVNQKETRSSFLSQDEAAAKKLWEVSARMTGL